MRKLDKEMKEYQGIYHKNSPNWSFDLRATLGLDYDEKEDCWLSINEIKRLFSCISICEVNANSSFFICKKINEVKIPEFKKCSPLRKFFFDNEENM